MTWNEDRNRPDRRAGNETEDEDGERGPDGTQGETVLGRHEETTRGHAPGVRSRALQQTFHNHQNGLIGMTTPSEAIGGLDMADEEAGRAPAIAPLAAAQEEDGAAPVSIGPAPFENPQQAAIFECIVDYIDRYGWAPSVREICEHTGLWSTSTVHAHLRRLEELRLIVRGPRQGRAITVVGRAAA